MGLFKRFNDIIAANLNELVDRFEDPEKGLRQAVREMEEAIQAATTETAKVLANQKRLEKDVSRTEFDIQRWNSSAEQFVDQKDDGGARQSLVRAADAARLLNSLNEQLSLATEASNVLRDQLAGMRSKLDEAKRELATLSARNKAAEIRKSAIVSSNRVGQSVVDSSAFNKFDRLREKVEAAEAEAEALAEIIGHGHSSVSAIAPDIETQLTALKQRRSNP